MEVKLNTSSSIIKFETNKAYSIISLNELKKDKFLKEIYALNKDNAVYVDLNNYDNMFNSNIYLDITNNISNIEIVKLKGFLELFKLDYSIMKKNFYELSNSEKKKIILLSAFLTDKQFIIINNSTLGLDKKSKYELLRIIKHEKRNNKVIILFSHDSNFIYEATDNILELEKETILNKNYFFSKTKELEKYDVELPDIEKFRTNVFHIKKVKLPRTTNINDLIKDVYRNVQ